MKKCIRFDNIRNGLANPRLPIILACLAIILTLPALGTGLQLDDYIHRGIILGLPGFPPPSQGLFCFFDGNPERTKQMMDGGFFAPWWTLEELRFSAFRPLAELSHRLDYLLWPDSPLLMHAHNLLWFGGLIWASSKLYRQLIQPAWIAGFAGVLYVLDCPHGTPVSWLANRNSLMATLFGVLTLLFHDRWRKNRWRAGVLLSSLCLILGLLSAEAALATMAYILAYTLIFERRQWRYKLIGLLPYTVIVLLWSFIYHQLGFGAEGSGFYVDPGRNPLAFVKAVFERAPFLLFGQWTSFPIDLYVILPETARKAMWIWSVLFFMIVGYAYFPLLKQNAIVRYWALGVFLALPLICAVVPSSRLLSFVGIGTMGMLAQFLASWFEKLEWLPDSKLWQVTTRSLVVLFIIVHLIIAPFTLPLSCFGFSGIFNHLVNRPVLNMPSAPDLTGKSIIIINPPSGFLAGYFPMIRSTYTQSVPAYTRVLASGIGDLDIFRNDEHTLEIQSQRGFFQFPYDQFFRGPHHPMKVGQYVELPAMSIEILALTDDQRPLLVRFRFSVPLNDSSIVLLQWKNGMYVPFIPPAVGNSVQLSSIKIL